MTALKPYIDIKFSAPIWRFEIDAYCLYLELRDAESKRVGFAAVSLATGKLCFQDVTLAETWLCNLSVAFNGVMLIQGFAGAGVPSGITAIDGKSGTLLWQNYSYGLSHVSISGVVAFSTQIQSQKLLLLNGGSGEVLRAYNAEIDLPVDSQIITPVAIPEIPVSYSAFVNAEITGLILASKYQDFTILSFHELIAGILRQRLLIVKGSNLVFNEVLNDKIQKLQPEAFMLYANRLIYIKNKSNIVVVNL